MILWMIGLQFDNIHSSLIFVLKDNNISALRPQRLIYHPLQRCRPIGFIKGYPRIKPNALPRFQLRFINELVFILIG